MNTISALLDEHLPAQLQSLFSPAIGVYTIADLGWQSKHNGELLAAMGERGIEFLITADRNLQYQQNMNKHTVRLVVIVSHDNRLKTLFPRVPEIEQAILNAAKDAKVIVVDVRSHP